MGLKEVFKEREKSQCKQGIVIITHSFEFLACLKITNIELAEVAIKIIGYTEDLRYSVLVGIEHGLVWMCFLL